MDMVWGGGLESLDSQYKSAVDVVKRVLELRVLWNVSYLIAGSLTLAGMTTAAALFSVVQGSDIGPIIG